MFLRVPNPSRRSLSGEFITAGLSECDAGAMSSGTGPDVAASGVPGLPARRPLRQNRGFTLLWASQTLSDFGSSMTVLAFPLLVLSIGGSAVQAGAAATAAAIAKALVGLPGGALSDRVNRRRLMIFCDASRLVLVAAFATTVSVDRVHLPVLIVVAVAIAALDVVFQPAEVAVVAQLVPAAQLPEAFARNEARTYAARLSGPPVGGLLFGVARGLPFFADAASYLISLLAVLAIRTPLQVDRADPPARVSLAADIAAGIGYVWHSRFLRNVVMLLAPANFAFTGAIFAVIVILRQDGHSVETVGLAQAVIASGGLLGAFAAGPLQRRASLSRLLISATCALFLLLLAATTLTGRLIMVLPLAGALFLAPALNAAIFGRLAATTPNHVQGRVVSVVILAAGGTSSLAPFLIGLLIERLSASIAMAACTIGVGISVIAAVAAASTSDDPNSSASG
jgi:MFS family permease